MTKLIIDRQRWLRGEGIDNSFLLRPTDCKMCCLGFYCVMLGFSEEEISNITTPSVSENLNGESILNPLVTYFEDGGGEGDDQYIDSDVCVRFTQLNDTPLRSFELGAWLDTEEEREQQLQQLFHEHLGVEVEFIN